MPSTKEIRIRIRAIKNTAKITRAMQMVAASKMKRAQDATLKNRPYTLEAYRVYLNLTRDNRLSHPIMARNDKASKKLLVVVTSDKGLCGSFNSAVIRKSAEYIGTDKNIDVITYGKYAGNFFRRTNTNIVASFTDFPVHPHTRDTRALIKTMTDAYLSGEYSEVAFCFTLFESTLKQAPTIRTILPLGVDQSNQAEPIEDKNITIKFEPSPKEVIDYLIPRILETWIYQLFLESIASEQSARMVAMKNATDAASDLVEDLNLTYNSIRQASITQELAEISAAANSFERN
ncbi:MAG: synthase subunit gamma, F-type H+-transporting ATPase subunit gamma [Candidatus Berkelbacteria bacterium]|nr:synthase subunit gamma, F-type H+-transporting ATPase subunit gamma [Candidatus Berkelbacteria bacterium]